MILGTAGHIDHGKTALVRALSGVDTDRLPEEKRRGITIELGFAPLEIAGVGTIGIVDVPGHEAFVRTMLAGATGVDLALVVVAADEGIMPQTREHLAILSLLGIRAGVIALTKSDLAEPDWLQMVSDEVRALVAGGPLATAEIIHCSATTGAGIPDLREALKRAALSVPMRSSEDLFRLPLDRVFSVKGTGTVVTGTIWSGRVRPGDEVVLLPGGREARVRGVESHGHPVVEATSGWRAALALAGVDRAVVEPRGTVLVSAGDDWSQSRLLRADVALLTDAPTIGPRTRVRFHLGTAELGARIVAVGAPVAPGATIPVRISLDSPIAARAGDRFVLRSTSPSSTIGGGIITDPTPPRRRVKPWPAAGANAATRLGWMTDEAGAMGVALRSLPIRLGLRPTDVDPFVAAAKRAVVTGGRIFARSSADAASKTILATVAAAHRDHPLEPGATIQSIREQVGASSALMDYLLAKLAGEQSIIVRDGIIAREGWTPGSAAAAEKRLAILRAALESAGRTPPAVDELIAVHGKDVTGLLKLLTRRGEAVQVASDRYFSPRAIAELSTEVCDALKNGAALTTSELRDKTGLTRKYVIPVLEYLDRTGITVRREDVRILAAPKAGSRG